jgi:DNA-binding NarL/FixJ family response regulator
VSDWLNSGREALQRGSWPAAKKAFERAISRDPSAEAFEGLGWALYWLGDAEGSIADRERAYRAYLERHDRLSAARVAMGLSAAVFDIGGPAVATGWVERAKTHLRSMRQTIVHGWLAFSLGHMERMVNDDFRAARKLARQAQRIAVRFGDTQLELMARALEGLTLVNEGKIADGMRRIDEATTAAMAGEMADIDSIANTCCMLLFACERVRDYKRAAQWQKRIASFCKQWKLTALFTVCSTQHAAMLAGSGNWRDAEAQLEQALENLEKTRPLLVPDVIVHLAELRRRQGRYDDALELIRRVETRTEAMLTRAAIALDSGDHAGAIEFADRIMARKAGEKWVERAAALAIIVSAGDWQRAANAFERLQKIARQVDAPIIRAFESRAAGDIASSKGDLENARSAYVESFETFDSVQAPFEAACTRVLLAKTLAALGRHSAAEEELHAAAKTFERLGATRELQRIKAGVAQSDRRPITERECEILHLVAEGLGDKELATRLRLSQHTVHRHVSNILRKLGATSRSAAVAHAVRLGWF